MKRLMIFVMKSDYCEKVFTKEQLSIKFMQLGRVALFLCSEKYYCAYIDKSNSQIKSSQRINTN